MEPPIARSRAGWPRRSPGRGASLFRPGCDSECARRPRETRLAARAAPSPESGLRPSPSAQRSPPSICEIAWSLLSPDRGQAGRGDRLAVALLFFVRDVIANALGDLGKLGLQHAPRRLQNQVSARARQHAPEHLQIAYLVKIRVGGDVVTEVHPDGLVNFPRPLVTRGH